jgi:hypothetical protein
MRLPRNRVGLESGNGRRHSMKVRNTLILCAILIAVPRFCYAYIDPATGSLVIQVVIGAVAAGLFAARMLWKRIGRLVKGVLGHQG